jgi:hypothetical protein
MKQKVYGSSDDLIELEGPISDEVMWYKGKARVTCSDGTVFRIEYDGNWHITLIEKGSLFEKLVLGNPAEDPHTDEDAKGLSAYSDVIVLKEGIEWVKVNRKMFKSF